jgi:P27 family predicted phage terminase small subunit
MGSRGPAPTPTEVLKLRGSWRANRNQNEPRPTLGAPKCPAWLDKEAKKKWKALVPELERIGLLTVIDGDALAAYCVAWSELKQATEILAKEGRYVGLESGYVQSHPALAHQRSAMRAVIDFADLFGLDPSSRTRLQVPAPCQEHDDLAEFLGEG